MIEKQLPQHIEAEMGVLGSLIIDPEAIDQVLDLLSPADFYRQEHRELYEILSTLAAGRIAADFITVCAEIERQNKSINPYYVTELVNAVPTSGNLLHYAGLVQRAAQNRRLIHAAGQIAAVAYSEQENALEQAEQLLYAIGQGQQARRDFSPASTIVNDCLSDLLAIQDGSRSMVGVPTGFTELDHYLGGMQRSDLLVLAGRPGMGKSALMLSIAYTAVLSQGFRTAIFSLEMSKKQLMQRLLSYESHIALYRLRNGFIQDHEWEILMEARERLATERLQIDDTGGLSLSALRSKARRLKASGGLDLIIVDYLQLMHADASENRSRNREQEIAEVSKGLKELAKELDVPVLALAQLSRAVESRQSKVPQLSDLRESGSIENDADVVMFVYRDDYYNGQASLRPGTADIIIAKHRNGPVGDVALRFVGEETRFVDIDYPSAREMRG